MIKAAFDTSGFATFAIVDSGRVLLNDALLVSGRDSDRHLVPWVCNSVSSVGLSLRDIQHWYVGTGPGTFSGIRVGMSFVNGVCAVTGARVSWIPGSQALCLSVADDAPMGTKIGVLHDARREQLILTVYEVTDEGPATVSEARVVHPDEADLPGCDRLVTCQGGIVAPLLPDYLRGRLTILPHIDAQCFFRLAGEDGECPDPVYVRPAVFVEPKPVRAPQV